VVSQSLDFAQSEADVAQESAAHGAIGDSSIDVSWVEVCAHRSGSAEVIPIDDEFMGFVGCTSSIAVADGSKTVASICS
jgi:hypothetical protein